MSIQNLTPEQRAEMRAATLTDLRQQLGVPVEGLRQVGRDPATARFTLQLQDGSDIRLGGIPILWSQVELGKVLAVACGVVPASCKANQWRDLMAAAFVFVVDVEEHDDLSFETVLLERLQTYVQSTASASRDAALDEELPFRVDGEVGVKADKVAAHIRREYSDTVDSTRLREGLATIGFQRRTLHFKRPDGKRSTKSYYVAPAELLELDEEEQAAT